MSVAFLFDNDGVLVDTSAYHWLSWQHLMEEDHELKMGHEEFRTSFGKRNELILKELAPDATEAQHLKWASRKEELLRQKIGGKVKLLCGMEEFLKQVVEAKIPHIIASSTPIENLKLYLTTTVLGRYFDAFVSGEEVAQGKPAPDIFIEAAHRLGFESQECVVFEDAPAGIEAGKSAGAFVVALETTHEKSRLRGYDLIYPSARELNLQEILQAFNLWKKGGRDEKKVGGPT